ncbi:MAG: hypothetical protein JWP38_2296 [Herbaspirillum sp.]|jgi:ribonuclease HI|nr:hypothetical protein [Herbaspirillum sp.]
MPTLAELQQAAYHAELVAGRRLARNSGLPERDALMQTLQRSGVPLPRLLAERTRARAELAMKAAERKQRQADAWAQKNAQKYPPAHTGWTAWFDGSARPNPGRIGLGGVLKNPNGELVELCTAAGHGDSNEAEFLALIAILETALRLQAAPLTVYGDSRVVIDSLRSGSHAGALSEHHARARALLAQLPNAVLQWIPRRRNTAADALSQRATSVPGSDRPAINF